MAINMSGSDQLLWPGRVTQVIDPHYFWMQLGSKEALLQFDKLQHEMQVFGHSIWSHVTDVDQLEQGQVVLVDTGDSDGIGGNVRWKRGQVARMTSGNSVDVFYVDFGNTELTTVEKICAKFPQQYRSCPPQAVRCSLAGIQPISKNWTSRGTKTFQKATSGRIMSALVMYGEPGYCEVSLYPSDGGNGRSVSHYLLDEDVAMPIEGRDVPEFVDDIPTFMAALIPQDSTTPSKIDQEPTLNNLQEPPSAVTNNNTPPSDKPFVEKYIPPIPPSRKNNMDTSHGSPGSYNLGTSPGSGSNHGSSSSYSSSTSASSQPMKSSPQKPLSLNTNVKTKEKPVVDFFPFDNVSTYPPTPVSPVKSPSKSPSYPPPGFTASPEGGYFTRSPSKYNHSENATDASSQGYRGPEGNGGSFRGRNVRSTGNENYYRDRENASGRYNRHSENHPYERSRFAANFNNLPNPGKGDYSKMSSSAAANFEPSYLNSSPEKHIQNQQQQASGKNVTASSWNHSESKYPRTPDKHYSDSDSASPSKTRPPFYPPRLSEDDLASLRNTTLTPPDFYQKSSLQNRSYDSHSAQLTPPGYFQSHTDFSPAKQSSQGYSNSAPEPYISPPKQYQHSGDQSYQYSNQYNGQSNNRQNYPNYTNHPNHQKNDHKIYDKHSQGDYVPNSSDNGYYGSSSRINNGSNHGNLNNSNHDSKSSRLVVKVNLPQTPSKSFGQDQPSKLSPVSPESPAIDAFNLGEIDHTQHTSTAELHQRMYQEKLAALQEEADDIAVESKEQSELVQIARYGCVTDMEHNDYQNGDSVDIFEQIAAEINYTTKHSLKEYEELRKSPIKRTRKTSSPERPPKIDKIPVNYIADIDFTLAVKEALEFGKTDGMENAKALLDGIVESLKEANVEKQLYDILLLMLAKSIQEYSLYHTLVMDTINALNGEIEIKDCLARALKRQQEMCVRVPVAKKPHHLDFSRVMGHVYNMSLDWSDSNASIQDGILVTVEKWIVFNNKGTQIGQTDKENVFLDCFGAFWEVSGTQLLQHNSNFRSRIRSEIRKKLLNESVSRSIRERLLDILMDLFSLNVQSTEAYTQTPRRTMIPSSCQVKPCVSDKGTMTKLDWRDEEEFYNIDPDSSTDAHWFAASEFVSSPDPGVSLRPRGKSYGHKVSSTPQNSFSSQAAVDNGSLGTPTNAMACVQDLSYGTNASESVYETPNESLVSEREKDTGVQLNINNHSVLDIDSETSQKNLSKSQMAAQPKQNISTGASSCGANINTNNVSTRSNGEMDRSSTGATDSSQKDKSDLETLTDKKSAMGKSIVDWFDYEPEPTNSSNKSGAKIEEKRLETKKKLNNTSMEIMENEVIAKTIVKGAVASISDGTNVSAKNSHKKSKKSKKSSPKVETVNSSLQKNAEESKSSPNKSVKDIDNMTSAVAVEPEVRIEAVTEEKLAQDVDWWGVGGPLLEPPRTTSRTTCDIYTDNGPDVIIEAEFDQLNDENDCDDVIQDFDLDAVADGILNEDEALIQPRQESPSKNQQVGNSAAEKKPESESKENQLTGDGSLRFCDGSVKQIVDEFRFDDSESDEFDNWESDSTEEFNMEEKVVTRPKLNSNYDEDFPVSDLVCVLTSSNADESKPKSDTEYNKNFPKSNLAEFIPQKNEEVLERAPAARWVPDLGKRKCMTCHDKDHKTENCPKGFILF